MGGCDMDYGDGVLIGGVRGRPRYNCTLRDGMPVRNPKGKCAKKRGSRATMVPYDTYNPLMRGITRGPTDWNVLLSEVYKRLQRQYPGSNNKALFSAASKYASQQYNKIKPRLKKK